MIGVAARPEEHDVVREFFELFKTPWEFYRADEHYAVLLVADDASALQSANLILLYGSAPTAIDRACGRLPGPPCLNANLTCRGERIPIYGAVATFEPEGRAPDVVIEGTTEPV